MEKSRIVFLDYLRVFACLLVVIVHACEQFYFNGAGDFSVATKESAAWTVFTDSACRACVPLFVMASSFLLFPVQGSLREFLKRRFVRVGIPFIIFAIAYTLANNGSFRVMAFNFPMATCGHLWFVPMLAGVYLMMMLLSPWAERVRERELRVWILVWFVTTLFPYLRHLSAIVVGPPIFGAVPFLYGECPWNPFGVFHYVSGFFGYVLIGLYFRRFMPAWSRGTTMAVALVLGLIGYAIISLGFWLRIPFDGTFPLERPYATAVDLEMSWEFCSFGVALMTIAYFLLLRLISRNGFFYRAVILPLSRASYGTYLVHIFFLLAIMPYLKDQVSVPLAIFGGALATFGASSLFSLVVQRIPFIGRLICG